MSRSARHRSLAVTAVVALLLGVPSFATAADEILLTVPVSGVHRGAEGTSVRVASVDVPAELVGQSCEIFGSTVNQRSVHPGNDLLIVNGDESFTIPDFEDEGDIVHDAGDVETLGATLQLFVVFGPDGASSGGFRVTVRNCSDVTVPDTTVPETTVPESTVPESTVPTESTESTESTNPAGPIEETTTTVDVEAETPTTAEPTSTSTTAEPTTAEPTTTTTTAEPAPTDATEPLGPTSTDTTLPVTGSSTALFVTLGSVLLAAGLLLRTYASRTA